MKKSKFLTIRTVDTVAIIVGCLFILSGGILEMFDIGRGGQTAYIIFTFSVIFASAYLLFSYLEWYSSRKTIIQFYTVVVLYSGLAIWASMGGNTMNEITLYNGVSDWVAFIGSIIFFLGMLYKSSNMF